MEKNPTNALNPHVFDSSSFSKNAIILRLYSSYNRIGCKEGDLQTESSIFGHSTYFCV